MLSHEAFANEEMTLQISSRRLILHCSNGHAVAGAGMAGPTGAEFQKRPHSMAIEKILSAPRSPWQSRFVERLIETLRCDCLDHVIALNDRQLRRAIGRYLDYYHDWRTHVSLSKDAPN